MKQTLLNSEKKILRARSYSLKPTVMIGHRGVSDAVLSEIDIALEAHELIKVRFRGSGKESRAELTKLIVENADAVLVHQIGRIAVFFRPQGQRKIEC